MFRLREHMERLLRSARFYHLAIPFSVQELCRSVLDLLRSDGDEGGTYIRPVVFFGEGPPQLSVKNGCPTHTMILTRSLGPYLGNEVYEKGLRLTVSSWRKILNTTLPTLAKATGQYLNSVIAVHEAIDRGFDDAILLASTGDVSECSGANIFFASGRRLITNDARSCILPGVTRDTVISLCRAQGIEVEIRTFTLQDLLDADEVFVTGTAAEVTPVREIDGHRFRTGTGTFGAQLQRSYRELVTGMSSNFERWLSFVTPASEGEALEQGAA